ncbi:protein FAR-RED IMPAIRED RESPONSE 1-like [Cannabis sativa]|uniref:protein FAR-RED IMPAIRED RESPONSE 1-like n=1 Tax=Cannabis sativa TaxID=3483 RepID=UPI0029CA3939|nr:protein FAR-RED IMPAIRED RESPONSE 1-like [Cannabis sativa]
MVWNSNSHEEAYEFYLKYAKIIGFGILRRSSRRSKISNEFIDVKFVCTRLGSKRESISCNPRPCLKIDCKATLHLKRRLEGKWYVYNFIKEHNHEVYPAQAHYFTCHRSIKPSNKETINTLHAVGVSTTKFFAVMAKSNNGYENIGCLEKDIRNHLDKEKRLALASGDASAMQELFMHMQEEDSNFFYAIDLDEEQRLKNVFWVDAKSREDYKIFGDVVSFDTTYITNKYKMPFAPFIGVNNHFQTSLLGCALLAHETKSTFVWLIKTWLRAMGGKALHDLEVSKTKGAPKRIKSGLENSRKRKSNDKSKKQLKQDSKEYIFLNDDECINGTF